MLLQLYRHGKFMFNLNKILLLLLLTCWGGMSLKAEGKISGKVVDGDTGEALIGVNVIIEGTAIGAASDIEGNYFMPNVPAGKYNLIFSMIGFAKKKVTGIIVKENEVTEVSVILNVETYTTNVVVINARALQNTEASLLSKRQKSRALSDAISAEQFSRTGAGNAADVVKQIVGASVVDGKYVFVRGLGSRYTSTQLNGSEIPSIDPYARAGSIDLIPSNLIDNIQAVKSFTPDRSGDFSGGAIDITTKDFPDRMNINISSQTSYNSALTFNGNGLSASGGSTDWLGFDDGSRALPDFLQGSRWNTNVGAAQRDEVIASEIDRVTKAFSPEMSPVKKSIPLNYGFSVSLGDRIDAFGNPLGFIGSFSYKRNNSGYINGELNRWDRGVADPNKMQLDTTFAMKDTKSVSEVLWGGSLKLSYKLNEYNQVSLNGMLNQNGISSARHIAGSYPYDIDPDWIFEVRSIEYKERSLGYFQMDGEHFLSSLFNAKVDWKASIISSEQNEPDHRFFYNYYTPDLVYGIKSNLTPERYFRETLERQKDFQINVSLPLGYWGNGKATIKFGGRYSEKDRSFLERRFIYSPASKIGSLFREAKGDINSLFNAKNIGWTRTDTLSNGMTLNRIPIYIQETDQMSSNYDGKSFVKASYVMVELPAFEKMKIIFGVRYENTFLSVLSKDPDQQNGQIATNDFLPSLNAIFSPLDNMNIRFSYGRTLARPTFREISPFTNYDFNGGDTYVGNPELERTLIDNYDLRWEWFYNPGDIYSISFFYKNFINPIEIKIQNAVNNILTWTNVPRASIKGIELEVRKNLNMGGQSLPDFSIGANFTYILSSVDIDSQELSNIRIYEPNASATRPFQGQSPYLINVYLNFGNALSGWNASLYYNVFGERLSAVGSVGAPDVYESPFQMLNVSISKNISNDLSIKLSAKNILNSSMEKTQRFKNKKYIYQSYKIGSSISAEMKYNL